MGCPGSPLSQETYLRPQPRKIDWRNVLKFDALLGPLGRQPKRRRLWLHDGSCVRLRAAHKDHVWSYDFVHERTHDGRAFRLLTLLDEYTRECLALRSNDR